MDKADPIIDELLPLLSHKTPKVVAATLSAFTSMFHAYGCKAVPPKPVLQALTKAYGHADKNVRTEAQNVTVELYRWLREGIKALFWNELKPVQQQDLEKLFDKVKDEPTPKPERLLKSQQATVAAAAEEPDADTVEDEHVGVNEDQDPEPGVLTVDAFAKIPKDFSERLGSSKWKDRKDALDDLFQAVNVSAIETGPFDEIVRGLAKSMKDANIAVVTIAGNCVEALAKGLRRDFAKYRSNIFSPIMERLKERKQSVTDALAVALDAVCASTGLADCLEETQGFLVHKNPLVKLEATRFLVRNLKSARNAPSVADTKVIAEGTAKLLTDSQETQRSAAAEALGVLLKIMGDRVMMPHLDGLDDIRKAKVKEYAESADVKSKYKPKATAPPPKAAPAPQKKPVGKKLPSSSTAKKPTPSAPPPPPLDSPSPPRLQPKPTSKPGLARPTASSGPRGLKPPTSSGYGRPPASASPRRPAPAAQTVLSDDEAPAPIVPKTTSRGLTGRQLSKPSDSSATSSSQAAPAQPDSTTTAELEHFRQESSSLRTLNDDLRASHLRMTSQIHELQDQNARLIEDHTRDILSIKAKETQLVRARSDAESAEQNAQGLQREVERLKRELGRMGRATSPRASDVGAADIFPGGNADSSLSPPKTAGVREGKENALPPELSSRQPPDFNPKVGRKLSPSRGAPVGTNTAPASSTNATSPKRTSATTNTRPIGSGYGNHSSSGIGRPPRDAAPPPLQSANLSGGNTSWTTSTSSVDGGARSTTSQGTDSGDAGVESWKRAAEVTQNLKARIELMRARQQSRG